MLLQVEAIEGSGTTAEEGEHFHESSGECGREIGESSELSQGHARQEGNWREEGEEQDEPTVAQSVTSVARSSGSGSAAVRTSLIEHNCMGSGWIWGMAHSGGCTAESL